METQVIITDMKKRLNDVLLEVSWREYANNNLRQKMKALAKHIEPKVYEYGFLKN